MDRARKIFGTWPHAENIDTASLEHEIFFSAALLLTALYFTQCCTLTFESAFIPHNSFEELRFNLV